MTSYHVHTHAVFVQRRLKLQCELLFTGSNVCTCHHAVLSVMRTLGRGSSAAVRKATTPAARDGRRVAATHQASAAGAGAGAAPSKSGSVVATYYH